MVSVLFVPFIIEDRSTTSMFFVVKNLRCEMFVDFVLSIFFWSGCFLNEAHIPDADFSIILSAEKMLKRLAAGLFLNTGW